MCHNDAAACTSRQAEAHTQEYARTLDRFCSRQLYVHEQLFTAAAAGVFTRHPQKVVCRADSLPVQKLIPAPHHGTSSEVPLIAACPTAFVALHSMQHYATPAIRTPGRLTHSGTTRPSSASSSRVAPASSISSAVHISLRSIAVGCRQGHEGQCSELRHSSPPHGAVHAAEPLRLLITSCCWDLDWQQITWTNARWRGACL